MKYIRRKLSINDALSTDEAIDGKPLSIIDAFEVLYKSDFTADNFTLSDGNRHNFFRIDYFFC